MIKHHPAFTLLDQFSQGLLTPGVALAVATHLEFCPSCKQLIADLECEHTEQLLEDFEHLPQDDLSAMCANIVSKDNDIGAHSASVTARPLKPTALMINDQPFTLPARLERLYCSANKWRVLGNVWTQKLSDDNAAKVNLLYMPAKAQVPEHSHQGFEVTLVLQGQLHDEHGSYQPGDFLWNTEKNQHSPATSDSESCLCLTVQDGPVVFQKGLARLLNPIAQWLY